MKSNIRMKIVVLNPPAPEESHINRDLMGGMGQKIDFGRNNISKFISLMKANLIHIPVMQLAYIATILSEKHDVLVIDSMNNNLGLEKTIERIKMFNPDFVFMAVSSSGVIYERDTVAGRIKEACGARIITVGDTIAGVPELLKQPFDISIVGEAESVAEKIVSGEKLEKIKGIMYRKGGRIRKSCGKLLEGQELEKLPFPKWELFEYKKFRYFPLLLKEPIAPMLASRGCPFACHYCSYSQNMGVKWRSRSAENIVDEIENNIKKYGFRGIAFRDPLFSMNAEKTKKIAELLIKKKLRIIWSCETRIELLNKGLIDSMYRGGCRGINIGIESVHENELNNVGRKAVPKEKITEIVRYAENKGIRTTCFFILGLPGATRKSVKEIIDFSIKLNPSHAEYKVATPFPGTKLYQRAKKEKWILSEEFEKFGGYSSSMKISDELSPEFLEKASSDAFKKFYFRGGYIFREIFRRNLMLKIIMMCKTISRAVRKQ